MDEPEAWRCQRHEDHRVLADRLGHSLAPTQPRSDELERIAAIAPGARGAPRPPAVAAALQQRAVWLPLRRIGRLDPAGGKVNGVDAAAQAHRLPAVASRAKLTLKPL